MPRSLRNAEIKGFVPLAEKERIEGRCLFLILNQEGCLKRRDSAKNGAADDAIRVKTVFNLFLNC